MSWPEALVLAVAIVVVGPVAFAFAMMVAIGTAAALLVLGGTACDKVGAWWRSR